MKYAVALLMILVSGMVGCSGANAVSPDTANDAAANITYSKDARTGLCFGSIGSTTKDGYQVVSITNVPCANVERLISKGQP